MQLHIVLYLTLCVQSAVFCQTVVSDEIRIYLNPEYLTSGISDDCYNDQNRTRVNSSVKISILDKNKIFEIEKLFLNQEYVVSESNDVFQHQIVLDFIMRGKIGFSFSISSNENLKIGEGESTQYFLKNEQIIFCKKYLNFFRE